MNLDVIENENERVSPPGVTLLEGLKRRREDLGPIFEWLHKHDFDPAPTLAAVAAKLLKRRHHLPKTARDEYFAAVILNEFLTRWVRHNKGHRIQDWIKDKEVIDETAVDEELRPFEYAVMLLCDEGAFKKQVPKLVRESEAKRGYIDYGSGDGFAGYAAGHSLTLANRMLVNFDPKRQYASRCAVNYLLKSAMSCYLKHRAEDPNYGSAGMIGYLKASKVDRRNVVAYKLAYCPMHLTFEERAWLRDTHHCTDVNRRWMVKDVAALLKYPTPATLSRKLYRMREWAKHDVMADAVLGGAE